MSFPKLEILQDDTALHPHDAWDLWLAMDNKHRRHIGSGNKNAMYDLADTIKRASIDGPERNES